MRYALDYEGYKTLWGGVTPGTNMWVGFFSAFGEDRAFSRDLDKARELLAEAGYPDGLDMDLEYPDMVYGGVSFNTNAQKIQADLAEAGINVTLLPGEIQVALEKYRSGEHSVGYWLWGPDILDPLDFLSFMPGGKVATERNNWDLDEIPQDIQDMIAAAKVASDPCGPHGALHRAARIHPAERSLRAIQCARSSDCLSGQPSGLYLASTLASGCIDLEQGRVANSAAALATRVSLVLARIVSNKFATCKGRPTGSPLPISCKIVLRAYVVQPHPRCSRWSKQNIGRPTGSPLQIAPLCRLHVLRVFVVKKLCASVVQSSPPT